MLPLYTRAGLSPIAQRRVIRIADEAISVFAGDQSPASGDLMRKPDQIRRVAV